MFSDAELSRILSAHANGELRRGGYHATSNKPESSEKCCVMQAAKMDVDRFFPLNKTVWFDENYNPGWPLGKFLRELERQGLA